MASVKTVTVLEGFEVELRFSDGLVRTVDLSRYMKHPIFDDIRSDPALFRLVYVDDEAGTIVWPNGADICPDVLYEGLSLATS